MANNYCVMTMAKRHRSDVRGLQKEAKEQCLDMVSNLYYNNQLE